MENQPLLSPYPGLRPFSEQESIYFKGREEHVDKCLKMLSTKHLILLSGASGDGKSSMVFSGILPKIRAGLMPSTYASWETITFRPERSPLDNFVKALSSIKSIPINEEDLLNKIKGGFDSLVQIFETWNASLILPTDDKTHKNPLKKCKNLLIIVDQFEEIFTNKVNFKDGVPSDDAMLLMNVLLEAGDLAEKNNIPLYIVFTMRSDFIGNCSCFRGFPERIRNSHYFIPRLSRNEIKEAIISPALLAGHEISPRLVERLLYDIKDGQDILPVLQHALFRIWKRYTEEESRNKCIDLIHYAKVGGMNKDELDITDQVLFDSWLSDNSLIRKNLFTNPSLKNVLNIHAEEIVETVYFKSDLENEDVLTIINASFLCLAKFDDDRIVRDRVRIVEIRNYLDNKYSVQEIYDILSEFEKDENSLIRKIDPLDKENSLLDIQHEALIRNWKKYNDLLHWEKSNFETYLEIRKRLDLWLNNNLNKIYLLSEGPYYYYSGLFYKVSTELSKNWYQKYENSNFPEDKREAKSYTNYFQLSWKSIKEKKQLKKLFVLAVTFLAIFGITGFVIAYNQSKKSEKLKELAITKEKEAKANEYALRAFSYNKIDPTIGYNFAVAALESDPNSVLGKKALISSYLNKPFYFQTDSKSGSAVYYVIKFQNGNGFISAAYNGNIIIYDSNFVEKRKLEYGERLGKNSNKVSISLNEKFIAANYSNGDLIIWNVDGKKVKVFKKLEAICIASSPIKNEFIVTCEDSTNKIINFSNGDVLKTIRVKSIDYHCKYSNSGDKMIFCAYKNSKISVYNPSGILLKVFDNKGKDVADFALTSDDKYLVASYWDNKIVIWNMENGARKKELIGHKDLPYRIAISPDDKLIVSCGAYNDCSVRIWDFDGNQLGISNEHTSHIWKIKFVPGTNNFVTASSDNKLLLWNLEGNVLNRFKCKDYGIYGFDVDRRHIYTGYAGGAVRIWRLEDKNYSIDGHSMDMDYTTFSEDRNFMVTTSEDKTVILRNEKGKTLRFMDFKHHLVVYNSSISGSNKYFATRLDGYKLLTWDSLGNILFSSKNDFCSSMSFIKGSDLLITNFKNKVKISDIYGRTYRSINNPDYIYIPEYYNIDGYVAYTDSSVSLVKINLKDTSFVKLSTYIFDKNTFKNFEIDEELENVVIYHKNNVVELCHFEKNKATLLFKIKLPESVRYCQLDPKNERMYVHGEENNFYVYNYKGELLTKLIGHTNELLEIEYVPKTKEYLTLAEDRVLNVWNNKGEIVKQIDFLAEQYAEMRLMKDEKSILLVGGEINGIVVPYDFDDFILKNRNLTNKNKVYEVENLDAIKVNY